MPLTLEYCCLSRFARAVSSRKAAPKPDNPASFHNLFGTEWIDHRLIPVYKKSYQGPALHVAIWHWSQSKEDHGNLSQSRQTSCRPSLLHDMASLHMMPTIKSVLCCLASGHFRVYVHLSGAPALISFCDILTLCLSETLNTESFHLQEPYRPESQQGRAGPRICLKGFAFVVLRLGPDADDSIDPPEKGDLNQRNPQRTAQHSPEAHRQLFQLVGASASECDTIPGTAGSK